MYNYNLIKSNLFKKEGLLLYTTVRDKANEALEKCGAFKECSLDICDSKIGAYDGWDYLACLDMMIENKELARIEFKGNRYYVRP